MRAVEIISKKRDDETLSLEEIETFIREYTDGRIPDYQAAAWLMAVYINGLDERETRDLTLAMAHSSDILDLKGIAPLIVDKHSTGGVGDKVSLIVAPLVAASGLPVAKISGRGLGFTGGTLDKLESIPGYRTDLNDVEFMSQLADIGIVLTGQTKTLAPADGKLYSLRDVTATVDSMPLIVSSILSKKLAGGADALVLDVKTGSGALMKTLEQAQQLARALVDQATRLGLQTVALVSDMNQPLGHAVGNAVEVQEAIAVLQGQGPADLREHCLRVAAEMLLLGKKATSLDDALYLATGLVDSREAWGKFRELVRSQGGLVNSIERPDSLLSVNVAREVQALQDGYLAQIDAARIGLTVMKLGGGREKKTDSIDHHVGVIVHHKVGDFVRKHALLATIYASSEGQVDPATRSVLRAHVLQSDPVLPLPLFYDRVTA